MDDDAAALPPPEGASGSQARRIYTRAQLEALRFVGDQRRLWEEAYQGLGESVAREYDGIFAAGSVKENRRRKNKNKGSKKGGSCGGEGHDICISGESYGELATDDDVGAEENTDGLDIDSDDEYDGILKPAFLVEGEPDFDSGPPVDGFEYIRRVRWEAAQIPNVKTAKLNPSILTMEQTQYMPEIPEIPQCPANLLPSKEWEEAFLTYFSQIRQAFEYYGTFAEGLFSIGRNTSSPVGDTASEPETPEELSAVCTMDTVTRTTTLQNYIDMVQSMSAISRREFLWLLALSVAVDTPLHSDTSASLRALLRKCSSILAAKCEVDDEVVMLNILITICGKYFGQRESK